MISYKRKRLLISLLCLIVLSTYAQEIKIMSFNMQQPNGTNWEGRIENVSNIIKTYQPDILGSQELHAYMRDQILSRITEYSYYGISRECDGSGESSYIFYKTVKYEIDSANSGTFWFKDDYLNCGRGYDPNYNRICTYIRVKEKSTGIYFYIYNSHFPTLDLYHARFKSANLLCQLAADRNTNDPVIFTGDFNSKEEEKSPIEYIKSGSSLKMRDTYREVYPTGFATTGFGTRFDYIFIEDKSNTKTLNAHIIDSPVASDHLPIIATVSIEELNDSVEPFKAIRAQTSVQGDKIILTFNNVIKQGINVEKNEFSISGGEGLSIDSVMAASNEVELIIKGAIMPNNSLKLSYSGSSITDTNNSVLPLFSNMEVKNRIPLHATIPGKIEAENYYVNIGMDEEFTSDAGAGINIGWIDASDYTEYLVYVDTDTNYTATFRGAGNGGKGQLSLMHDGVKSNLCNIIFKSTGGWQKWTNFESTDTFKLSKGKHTIRYTAITGGYNINYFNINIASPKTTAVETEEMELLKIFPNPSNGKFRIQSPLNSYSITVFDLGGKTLYDKKILNKGTFSTELNLSYFSKGIYLLKVESGSGNSTQKLIIK